MGIQTRSGYKFSGPGPFVGIVVNNIDDEFMGRLEVALIRGNSDNGEDIATETVSVKYLSPFYGVTSVKFNDESNFTNYGFTQKSYGFWMVPPDLDTRVLCIFADGDFSQGFWIGCVADKYMNHMIPGIASDTVLPTDYSKEPDTFRKYGGLTNLPVAEYNKKNTSAGSQFRPIHTAFADALAQQGLLGDSIRGVTSSSARRESPSSVFGFSTPGPLDTSPDANRKSIRFDTLSSGQSENSDTPVSRLGGQSFVMDDGDKDGNNELVRIRTRTGHQILMHNSADLIYIANSKGTAWIELTSNGKIDIYAQDSVSIHSNADFNFRADRNFNIEAGGEINISAGENIRMETSSGEISAIANTNISLFSYENFQIWANKQALISGTAGLKLFSNKETSLIAPVGIKITSGKVEIAGNEILQQGKVKTNSGPVTSAQLNQGEIQSPKALTKVLLPDGSASVRSIMGRMPTAEPWPQHENTNPQAYFPDNTTATPVSNNAPPPTSSTPVVPGQNITYKDVLKFDAYGSGDEAHFLKTSPELQKAIIGAASEFKAKTGNPVKINSSYRSYEEQKAIYNRWLRGDKTIYTPVNPDTGRSPHMDGISVDTNQAGLLDRYGLLAKYNLKWPFPRTDPVHIQLIRNVRPQNQVLVKITVLIFKGLQTGQAAGDVTLANTGLAEIASQINANASKGFKATVLEWNDFKTVKTLLASANGPIIMVGFSKGVESILTVATTIAPQKKFAQAFFLDGIASVTLSRLTAKALPANIETAFNWYNPNAQGYNGQILPDGTVGRITNKRVTGLRHAAFPSSFSSDIVSKILQTQTGDAVE